MCFRPTALFLRLLVFCLMYKGHGATMVPAIKHERIIDYDQLRNAVFLKSEDILLAGDRRLHKLRADLSIKQEAFLCDPISCENTNKILVVTEDQSKTIICGTRNEGRFEMRFVANLSEVSTNINFPTISTKTHIPALALVTKSNSMIIGYTTTEGGNFVYKIMGVMLTNFMTIVYPQLGSELNNATMPLVYFKTALSSILNVNRNYVLIHKKESANNYKSQMVIVCGALNTTIDISCTHDNKNYNLIQDADIFDTGTSAGIVFVGAFGSSNDPLSESGDSVVCIQKLNLIDQQVSSRTCGRDSDAVTLTSSYKLPNSEGYITSIKGDMTTTTNRSIINIGTSTGRFIQTSRPSEGGSLQQFAYRVVQEGAPVVAIHSQKNGTETYVVTRKKIALYLSANCDNYKTCTEAVSGNNPLCGWCFFEGRSTTESSCSSGWISMVGACSSISVSPGGQRVGESQALTISATGIPSSSNLTGDVFHCFIQERKTVGIATYNGNMKFNCNIPMITEHQTTSLEIVGTRSGKEFVVGKTEYLIYKCDQFKRCGQCIDKRVQCKWCLGTCEETGASCTSNATCPVVTDKEIYVPDGVESDAIFDVTLPSTSTVACYVKKDDTTFPGTLFGNTVNCKLKIPMTDSSDSKQIVSVLLKYGQTSASAELDKETNVTVYRCDRLAKDCTHCQALNSRYQCHWDSAGTCIAGPRTTVPCSSPKITTVSPLNSPWGGTTVITINVTDFKYTTTNLIVVVAGVSCTSVTTTTSGQPDFKEEVIDSISCNCTTSITPSSPDEKSGVVELKKGTQTYLFSGQFEYKTPKIISISPDHGLTYGGTQITFTGSNLALGNKNVIVRYNNAFPLEGCAAISSVTITCTLQLRSTPLLDMNSARFIFDGAMKNVLLNFTILKDPVVRNVSTAKTILSGGTVLTISGDNFTNANDHNVVVSYNGHNESLKCDNASSTLLQCRFPPAPENLKTDLDVKLSEQKERDSTCQCVEATIKIMLDAYEKDIIVSFYPDPEFENFTDVKTIDKDDKYITLTGSYLDLAASPEEFLVNIGKAQCTEIIVTSTSLRCKIPDGHDDGSQYIVTVNVGTNFERNIGYFKYDVSNVSTIVTIVGIVLAILVAIGIVVGSAIYGKFYMMRRKRRLLEQKLQAMEMEITSIARQEFAEMASGMSFVNRTLVDQGLPFHGYQQYAFNVMFSSDQVLIDQPGQVKQSARKGLDSLEKLILNKMFLVSLVSTMEKEKRFFFKERANLSGNLCAILMGKMGYLNEVLQDLLMSLVHSAMANKTHKSLFRRCETITENLLSNWLALTMYPHLKAHSGSPLYLLFMAMQLTIENGPIDAITGDAKYSLSEEKLLRRWQSSRTDDNDVQFDGQPMTLKVIIDNGDQVYDCKVLDCDTITQVKSKSLSQIYVNYPASQLGVDPTELRLEWCAGHTAPAILKDEDNTSIKRGCLVRLNTLAHYNVPDKANMALVDPKTLDQEDYMNIKLDFPGQTKDTTKLIRGASEDVENPDDSTKWHLVKPEEDETEQRERSAIDELYLNKLFTTKQSINEYLTTLFDHILDSELCPPPAKFICDYMDILANKFKIDENTLFAWKSHSYAARVWGRMIRQPNQLFDVNVPQYVEDSLDVIAQVLEDSLAPSAPKLSKDCPGQKQVFYSEVQRYREKAKGFQKGLQAKGEQSNVLTEFLGDLNKMQQQQQSFNKMAYLQKLYDQLSPYLDEIVDGLASNTDTKNLELDKKMREVIDMLK